jgi:hypothetical protein
MIKSRRIRWEGHVEQMGEKMNPYRIYVGKPEGKIPLRSGWVDNIKMDLREIKLGVIDWIDLTQDRDQWRAGSCEHGDEPSGSLKLLGIF